MKLTSTVGRGLGALSVGLGTAQLLLPRRLLRTTGFRTEDPAPGIVRAIGVRELVAGAGLLSLRRPTPFAWFRVLGDVMDLALMGSVALRRGLRKDRATATLGLVGLVSAADLAAGVLLARASAKGDESTGCGEGEGDATAARGASVEPVRATITIDRPADEVYAAWRRLDRLPAFMRHLRSVTETGDGRSHWVAVGPGGTEVAWDAEITDDRPGHHLAWRSLEGSQVHSEGDVTFTEAPGGRGTEVHVAMAYEPPAGRLGALVAKLTGEEPALQVPEDLHRFKQLLETGTIARSKDDGEHGPASTAAQAAAREGRHEPATEPSLDGTSPEPEGVI